MLARLGDMFIRHMRHAVIQPSRIWGIVVLPVGVVVAVVVVVVVVVVVAVAVVTQPQQ